MKKSVLNVALAILISLGVVACKSTDNPVKDTPKVLNNSDDNSNNNNSNNNNSNNNGGNNDNGKTPPTGFESKSAAEKIKYLKENNIQTGANGGPQPAGTIVAGHAKTYASYAAVRDVDDSNKYVIDSTMYTPVSQKDYVAKLDATYVGKSSMTSRGDIEKDNDVDNMDITLKVKDNHISGTGRGFYTEGDSDEKFFFDATFHKSAITVKNDKLGFGGSLDLSDGKSNSKNGSYEGYFSGNQAEEVVGKFNATFEDVTYDGKKDIGRVTGAFVAEKQ